MLEGEALTSDGRILDMEEVNAAKEHSEKAPEPLSIVASVLFTAAMALTLLFSSVQQILLDGEIYKRLLVEDNVYERLPALLAESAALERLLAAPCTDDVLSCLDQDVRPAALQTEPGTGSPGDNAFASASAGVQACVRQVLGDETYEALASARRLPSQRETRKLNACIRQERREARLQDPGLGSELAPLVKNLSQESREALFRALFPAPDLQHMTESTLDQAFAFLSGQSATASVPLGRLNARLAGQAGEEIILILLAAQPPCSAGQLVRIDAGDFENGGGPAVYCAVSDEALAKVLPPMRLRLDAVRAQLPEEINLVGPRAAGIGSGSGGDALGTLRVLVTWMRFSPLAALCLLPLMTALGVRSVRGLLQRWGIPLLIAGAVAFGFGSAAQAIANWAWSNYAAARISSSFASGLTELGQNVLRAAAGELGGQLMLEAGLIMLLGLAAIIGSMDRGRLSGPTRSSSQNPD